ncbi:MAG TPA: phasin family protein [Desulfobacterales bacterium]
MKSEAEKLLATGMGAVLLTRDKIEAVVRKRVEESGLGRDEAEKLVEELYRSGGDQWAVLKNIARQILDDTRSTLNIGSRQALEQLYERMESLEKRVSLVEELCRRGRAPGSDEGAENENPKNG